MKNQRKGSDEVGLTFWLKGWDGTVGRVGFDGIDNGYVWDEDVRKGRA